MAIDRFQAITAFARVVEAGSFVRAASRLGVSVSAVSRHVAELEAHLDARLLNRTTRRLSLTESGRAFYERCVQLLADLEEAEQSAAAGTVRPRGTLRITCAITFGTRYLAPAIAEFVSRYPDMRVDVELSDRTSDLIDEGFDAAVRIGTVGNPSLVARRIGQTQLVCCAAPSYLSRHGTPATPADLAHHACLTYEYASQRNAWTFTDDAGSEHLVRVSGPVHANNGGFLAAVSRAGTAIVLEPDFQVGPDLRAGTLVRLLTGYEGPRGNIYVVYPSRRHLSAKVRAFTDFLAARFVAAEWMLEPPRRKRRHGATRVKAS